MTAAEYFGGRSFIDRTYPANHPMRELLVTSNPSTTTVAAFDYVKSGPFLPLPFDETEYPGIRSKSA